MEAMVCKFAEFCKKRTKFINQDAAIEIMSAMINELDRKQCELTTTIEMLKSDIEALKKNALGPGIEDILDAPLTPSPELTTLLARPNRFRDPFDNSGDEDV